MKHRTVKSTALVLCALLLAQTEFFCACHAREEARKPASDQPKTHSCCDKQASDTAEGAAAPVDTHQPKRDCCCQSHAYNQHRQIEAVSPVTIHPSPTVAAADIDNERNTGVDGALFESRLLPRRLTDFKIPLYILKTSLLI